MLTISALKAFIRSNGYAWPGGYPCALYMGDGEVIDAQSARENYKQIRRNMVDCFYSLDWRPVSIIVHYEGEPLQCAHSGRFIESAYGV